MNISTPTCTLHLPAGYRVADMLKFHQRDAQAFSERVANNTLHKGIVWDGQAACLGVWFQPDRADVKIAIDGRSTAVNPKRLASHVERMFGLMQPIDAFEACFRQHPQIGPLLARQSGLRVPLAATPFEALTWAVTGQQISVSAAVSMRRKLIKAAGLIHSDGLACYPDAARLASLSEDDFRAAGYSANKTRTLITISRQVLSGELPLDDWLENPPVDEICERLLNIRGIGPWTVNYTLLRGFGWLDGSLHGDVAVRRALQRLPGTAEKISEAAAKSWLEAFSPWRALVGAHLWASLTLVA